MTSSTCRNGALEICLSYSQAKVFDCMLFPYLRTKTPEAVTFHRLKHLVGFLLNLGNAYQLWFTYPKLGKFNFVFQSERSLNYRGSENDGASGGFCHGCVMKARSHAVKSSNRRWACPRS